VSEHRQSLTPPPEADGGFEDGYFARLGRRIRRARARRGMTRKLLSRESGISERYLAQLEAGRGNASIALLRQVATAMSVPLVELVDDRDDAPVELELIVERLRGLAPETLSEVHRMLLARFGDGAGRLGRIALIGLRGAGKSTLGQALAQQLALPFVQVNAEIEREVGMSLDEIFNLMGQAAYRRLERRALDRIIETHRKAVIETGGGLVADAGTFERLLSSCFTIWLKARPEEHMARVIAQGDSRPMAGNREAMADLKRILAGREALYGKADAVIDTSARDLAESLAALRQVARRALAGADAP
jgi:XRE family aerobic/anaerobic benzoate catabolism transcriptional regulator